MATATKPKTKQELISGADILVQSLVNHGVDTIFAYPGGASMPLHQALTRFSDQLRTILPRHEQGGAFAAQGIARSTGKVGVCMATSGPGATNLVTAIADAKLDSIPLIAITGQVPTHVIGNDAFQETPIVEVCRGITKHHYLVTDVNDIARVVKEAFHHRHDRPARPGADRHAQGRAAGQDACPTTTPPPDLPGFQQENPQGQAGADQADRRGDQAGQAADDLRRRRHHQRRRQRGAPHARQEDRHPGDDDRDGPRRVSQPATRCALDMLGMHGSVYANYAVEQADLLIALGVRFDDRVTGKVEEFCKHGKIVHVDIDASELNKNKPAHIPVCSDVKYALAELNKIVEPPDDISAWVEQCEKWKEEEPFHYNERLPRHPAAARDPRAVEAHARPRSGHHGGRRPAPDVGRPVLQVQQAADVPLQRAAWARWASACPPRWACRANSPTGS